MRHSFAPQIPLGATPISDIELDLANRHEIIPILRAMQYLYLECPALLDDILRAIAGDVLKNRQATKGCKGLSYWEIFVLAALRLGCDYDYDELADTATNHKKVQAMMGNPPWTNARYPRSTVHDNLTSLSPETLDRINQAVISIGHELVDDDPLKKVRGDSFVVEKNIHYPTDSSLIGDAARKSIDLASEIANIFGFDDWIEGDGFKRKIKQDIRAIGRIGKSRKADKEAEMKDAYEILIGDACSVISRANATIERVEEAAPIVLPELEKKLAELRYYMEQGLYVCDLAVRRVFNGEKIPNGEKIFSVFEPDTELINRGKTPNPIEFGHRILVVQDAAGFIIHGSVMANGFTDDKVVTDIMEGLQTRYDGRIESASFDKGFWSPHNFKALSEFIQNVVIPKKGKRNEIEQVRETGEPFASVRKWHAGIESLIGSLVAGNGMKRCRDKGVKAYDRYVALAILGRNLHTLGRILIKKDREKLTEESPQLQAA